MVQANAKMCSLIWRQAGGERVEAGFWNRQSTAKWDRPAADDGNGRGRRQKKQQFDH